MTDNVIYRTLMSDIPPNLENIGNEREASNGARGLASKIFAIGPSNKLLIVDLPTVAVGFSFLFRQFLACFPYEWLDIVRTNGYFVRIVTVG